jgi:predicted ribosome quality control (RQC) complex YloA/Tae2 family protein
VDYTTLAASAAELRRQWCPARVEQVLQVDKQTVALHLRTLNTEGWLYLSWHPQMGHLGIGGHPHRGGISEAFSFGEQLQSTLRGMILTDVRLPAAWERVVELRLVQRTAVEPANLLYCELMGHYSNVILTTGGGKVLAAGYQVGRRPGPRGGAWCRRRHRRPRLGPSRRALPPPRRSAAACPARGRCSPERSTTCRRQSWARPRSGTWTLRTGTPSS